jgi:excisionase family DNA binding protein
MKSTDWGINILTVQEVAAVTGYKPVTIYRLASEGRIPSFRIQSFLRFEEQSVKRWMDQRSTARA